MAILKQSDSLNDVFSWIGGIKIFNQVKGLFGAFILEAIYDHIQSSLWEKLN